MQTKIYTAKTLQHLLDDLEIAGLNPDELYNNQILSIVITPLPHQWIATVTFI